MMHFNEHKLIKYKNMYIQLYENKWKNLHTFFTLYLLEIFFYFCSAHFYGIHQKKIVLHRIFLEFHVYKLKKSKKYTNLFFCSSMSINGSCCLVLKIKCFPNPFIWINLIFSTILSNFHQAMEMR